MAADKTTKVRQYQIMDIIQDPVQLAFLVIAVFTAIMIIPFTKAGYDFINDVRSSPKMP